jgi:chaperonin GroEL
MLLDIAVLTGGQVITEDLGFKLDKTELTQLGRARKVIATKEFTTIVDGQGEKSALDNRVAQIRQEYTNSTSDYDKEKLQERIARLSGGVGVIKVGAFTETEMKAKKFKIEDALNATKAAVEEGIVAGGGAALARIAPKLDGFGKDMSFIERAGVKVVRSALEAPLRQIAANAGIEPTGIISYIQTIDKDEKGEETDQYRGYDFSKYQEESWEKGVITDMMKAGIVDPVKVTRLALENAVSVASTLVTTEAIIVDKPEPKAPAGGAGMPGMGGMGGMGMDY